MVAKLYRTTGQIIELKNRKYEVDEIQKMVGGYFEVALISQHPFVFIMANEEGKRLKLPLNNTFLRYLSENAIFTPYHYVGDIILFNSLEDVNIFDGKIDPVTKRAIPEN